MHYVMSPVSQILITHQGILGVHAALEAHETAVSFPRPLLLRPGPHHLDAVNGPEPPEDFIEQLLSHAGSQVAHIQVGGKGVAGIV
jgi:hypothetical protein